MTLPPELRARVYEYIALEHTTRRVRAVYSERVDGLEYKITTSAVTATCRLIHGEYEDVARKATTALEFTAIDLDFNPIVYCFHRRVDAKFLATLRMNKATIRINLVLRNHHSRMDLQQFYTWALFLLDVKLEATYHADDSTWSFIHEASDSHADLAELCVIDEHSTQAVRENIEEIRRIAGVFDRAVWSAYSYFFDELQTRYHRYLGQEWRRSPRSRMPRGRTSTGAE